MGSGTTGIAAIMENFNFIGCEIDADYFSIAEERIKYFFRERRRSGNY